MGGGGENEVSLRRAEEVLALIFTIPINYDSLVGVFFSFSVLDQLGSGPRLFQCIDKILTRRHLKQLVGTEKPCGCVFWTDRQLLRAAKGREEKSNRTLNNHQLQQQGSKNSNRLN